MRQSIKNRILYLVISNKIPKFVVKLFFMGIISDFKNGETVCLRHDVTKRFIVKDNVIVNGMIQLLYFNPFTGVMSPILMDPKYLMIAPKQEQFCSSK